MERKRLIVNADDFGLTDGVNRAVVDGHRNGIITSATLMANGDAFESAVALVSSESKLGVGIHLNLVEGRPVAPASRRGSLVDSGGRFAHSATMLAARVAAWRVRLDDVEAELRAQIERVIAAGIRPTHVDGHKHAHLAPRVFEVVARLAQEYGIRGIRCAPSAVGAVGVGSAKERATARALSVLARRNDRARERAGLRSPSRLLGVAETGHMSRELLAGLARSPGGWPAELMCHPGYVDEALRGLPTRLTTSRERELDALTAPETRALLEREGIELIHYGNLGGPT